MARTKAKARVEAPRPESMADGDPKAILELLTAAVQTDFAGLGRNSVAGDLENYLPAFVDADAQYLRPDHRPHAELHNWSSISECDEHGLSPNTAQKLTSLVGWLFITRPVGCPIRAGISAVVTKLRAALVDPRTIWDVESKYLDEENPKQKLVRHAGLLKLVGGEVIEGGAPDDWVAGRDDGTLVLAPHARSATEAVYGGFYTAKCVGKAVERIRAYALRVGDWKQSDTTSTAALILSDGFGAFADRVTTTPVPAGQFEANPLASVPALVAKVAKQHAISSDAAALMLQTLALAEPTLANVTMWNAWTADQYGVAAAELVKKKLVVEGKHPKADRKIFLKGAVVKASERRRVMLNRPIEEWKREFYGDADGKYVLREPCQLLFARAWKRAESDPPT